MEEFVIHILKHFSNHIKAVKTLNSTGKGISEIYKTVVEIHTFKTRIVKLGKQVGILYVVSNSANIHSIFVTTYCNSCLIANDPS